MKLNIKVLILTLISILNVFVLKSIQQSLIYSLSKMDISRLILIPVLRSILILIPSLISGLVLGYINFDLLELILR